MGHIKLTKHFADTEWLTVRIANKDNMTTNIGITFSFENIELTVFEHFETVKWTYSG